MAHWEHRPEGNWSRVKFGQPYEKGLRRLKEEVLAKTDFDPATLWQWGTMQAMAIIGILKACERRFGAEGQEVVRDAIREVGLDVGRQIMSSAEIPDDIPEVELISFFATIVNRIAYASLEAPRLHDDDGASFDILWCPHQDHYGAFDCRVQRYFVRGMLDALAESGRAPNFDVRFDSTIPAGAETCHFTLWRRSSADAEDWARYTAFLDEKALRLAQTAPTKA